MSAVHPLLPLLGVVSLFVIAYQRRSEKKKRRSERDDDRS